MHEKTRERSPTDTGEETNGEANLDTCKETPKETAFSCSWRQMPPNCLVALLKHQEGPNTSTTCTSTCKTMFLLWKVSLRTLSKELYFIYFGLRFHSSFYTSLFTLTLFTQSFIVLFYNAASWNCLLTRVVIEAPALCTVFNFSFVYFYSTATKWILWNKTLW